MEHCKTSNVYLYVPSLPVIEESTNIKFGEYPTRLLQKPPGDQVHTQPLATRTNTSLTCSIPKPNNYQDVKDFSWIRTTPSPNWSIMEDTDKVDWVREINTYRAVPTTKTSEWVREAVNEVLGRVNL